MDRQLLRVLAAAWQGAADAGECLWAAARIRPGDAGSWFAAWHEIAERVAWTGTRSLAAGHRLTAGQAYLRAATYFRAAEYFAAPLHPGLHPAVRSAAAYFFKGLQLLNCPAAPVRIPYETTALPGYFFRAAHAGAAAPLLVVCHGDPDWPENVLHIAEGALRRGWHCLLFAGPGQGLALREQGLPYRPDWECVVAPALDFALARPEVDPQRLGLIGLGVGGALAARAAACETRLRLCAVHPAFLSVGEVARECLAGLDPALPALADVDPEAFNLRLSAIAARSSEARWYVSESLWRFGAASPADLLRRLREFDIFEVVGRIRCRVLVVGAAQDSACPGPAFRFFEALACPKHYLLFSDEDAASLAGAEGAQAALNHQLFDWLEGSL